MEFICNACFSLEKISSNICDRCGRELLGKLSQCNECRNSSLTKVRSMFRLTNNMKQLLYMIKFGSHPEYLEVFKDHIITNFIGFFPENITIVPIPSNYLRFWKRKFNQSEILAKYLAYGFKFPINLFDFIKIRNTEFQRVLTRKRRLSNLKKAFLWTSKKAPENVLLVDDVYTTGSTLEASAKALKKAGVSNVYGWTLFRTPEE